MTETASRPTIANTSLEQLSHKPLRSSHGANWNGVRFEHRHQAPRAVPEAIEENHDIQIPLFKHPQKLHWSFNGSAQRQQQLARGEIVIVPAQVSHRVAWESDIESIKLELTPNLLTQIADESIRANRIELIPTFAQADPLIYQLGIALKTVLETDGSRSRLYAESVTTLLSAHLLQHYCIEKPVFKDYSGGLSKYKLNRILDYIQAHLDQDLSLTALAAEINLSPYHFSRLFKQSVGVSVHQYVIQCRIEQAKTLLLQGKLSITEIAFEVGFANPSHLSHHFKRLVGVTPKLFVKP